MSLMKRRLIGSLYIVHWCCFWTSDTACVGDKFIKFIFDLEGRNPSTIKNITWDFTSQKSNITEFMANFSNGQFIVAPSFSNRLYHLSKNGTDVVNLNLSQLTTAEAGTYKCHIQAGLQIITLKPFKLRIYQGATPNPLTLKASEIHNSATKTTICKCTGIKTQGDVTEVQLIMEGFPSTIVARTKETSLSYMFRDDDDGNYICLLGSLSEEVCTTWNHSGSCQWQKPQCDGCLYLTMTLVVFCGFLPIFGVILYFFNISWLNGSGKGIRPKDILLILLLNITSAFVTLTTVFCFISCRNMGEPVSSDSSLYKLVITFATLGGLEIFFSIIVFAFTFGHSVKIENGQNRRRKQSTRSTGRRRQSRKASRSSRRRSTKSLR